MNKSEFIDKLSKSFKDGSEFIYGELKDWIDLNYLSEFQLMTLYSKIKLSYKYRTFPSLATIAEYFNEEFSDEYKNNINFRETPIAIYRKSTDKLSLEDLFNKLHGVFKKLMNGDVIDTFEMDLWNKWDPVYTEYLIMKDLEYGKEQIKKHLEYVHKCMSNGNKFSSKFYEAKMKVIKNQGDRKNKTMAVSEVL